MQEETGWAFLPLEILEHIFYFLRSDIRQLANAQLVCTTWMAVVDANPAFHRQKEMLKAIKSILVGKGLYFANSEQASRFREDYRCSADCYPMIATPVDGSSNRYDMYLVDQKRYEDECYLSEAHDYWGVKPDPQGTYCYLFTFGMRHKQRSPWGPLYEDDSCLSSVNFQISFEDVQKLLVLWFLRLGWQYDKKIIQRHLSWDQELVEEAIPSDGSAVMFADPQTPDMCLKAVQNQWRNIRYIKNPTEDICAEAVRQDPWAIELIESPSENVYLSAIQRSKGGFLCHLLFDRITSKTPRICLELIRREPEFIQKIDNPTEEMWGLAVSFNSSLIRFAPSPPSMDVFKIALAKDPYVLRHMSVQPEELCLLAVRNLGTALRHVKQQTLAECLAAVTSDRYCDKIEYRVFKKHPSVQPCQIVHKKRYALEFVLRQNPVVCLAAVRKDPYNQKFVTSAKALRALEGERSYRTN